MDNGESSAYSASNLRWFHSSTRPSFEVVSAEVSFKCCLASKFFIMHLLIYGLIGPLGLVFFLCWNESCSFLAITNLTQCFLLTIAELVISPVLMVFCIVKLVWLDQVPEKFSIFNLLLCLLLIIMRSLYKSFKFGLQNS